MIVSLYAGILGIFLIFLSVNVIKNRRKHGAALGDHGAFELQRAIRAQGNFIEYSVFFLVLFGYCEMNGAPAYALHAFGSVFIIGRAAHAYSLLKAEHYENGKLTANPIWRIGGMMCSFTTIAALSLFLIAQYFL